MQTAILLLLAGAILAAYAWPALVDELFTRMRANAEKGKELADEFAADLMDNVTGRQRAVPGIADPARPLDAADSDRKTVATLFRFVEGIEGALVTDDPAVWPDEKAATTSLIEAAELLDRAELEAERAVDQRRGGSAAADTVGKAVAMLVKAQGQGAPKDEQRALLSRAVWIRARDTDHRFLEEGALTALRYANDALEVRPDHPGARIMHARCQVALGRLDAARTALVRFLQEHADDPEALRTRSRWLYAHGDERGAADAVVDVFDRFPPVLAMAERLRVGRMLQNLGQWRGAEEVYDALCAWDEPLAEAWAGKARCLFEKHAWSEAQDAARKSIEIEPNAEARSILRRAMVGFEGAED